MKFRRDFIPLFRSIDGSTRRLPIMVVDSEKAGPVIFLCAAIHGDEVNGTAVIQSVFKKIEREQSLISGKIVALPILNPAGFEMVSRHEPYAEADLNRQFPGRADGDYPQRLAYTILSLIEEEKPEVVLDLHTDSINSIAYTIVDFPKSVKNSSIVKECMKLAYDLGFHWAVDSEEAAGYPIEKSLSGSLVTKGIKAVTIELGGPWVISEEFRKLGFGAVWRLLGKYDMVKVDPDQKMIEADIDTENILVFKDEVKIQSTGIVEFRVTPGQKIEAGQVLGKVRDVFGRTVETITSPRPGVVFSHDDQSAAFPGKSLFTIAYSEKFSRLEKLIITG